MNSKFKDRCWVEVDLDAISHNTALVIDIKADCEELMAVVKSNAYGLGANMIAKTLQKEFSVKSFAVANLYEAQKLKDAIEGDILIFGYTPLAQIEQVYKINAIQTLINEDYAKELDKKAGELGIKLRVSVAIDTGMHRIGFKPKKDFLRVFEYKNLKVQGAYSHFSRADSKDQDAIKYTKAQAELFEELTKSIKGRHIQNSAAILTGMGGGYEYIRPGIIIYGLTPSEEVSLKELKPAISLRSVVSMIKDVEKGAQIGYGNAFKADGPMKIATIPIGYADGYPRAFSNKGKVLINGKKAKVVGNVCMDQLMVDVSGIPCGFEDVVTIFGGDGENRVCIDDAARSIGSIGYEIISGISNRVPRVYLRDNKVVEVLYL